MILAGLPLGAACFFMPKYAGKAASGRFYVCYCMWQTFVKMCLSGVEGYHAETVRNLCFVKDIRFS